MSKKESNNKKLYRVRKPEHFKSGAFLSYKNAYASPLHRFIYTSTVSLVVSAVLIFSFAIQGVYVVFASENVNPELTDSQTSNVSSSKTSESTTSTDLNTPSSGTEETSQLDSSQVKTETTEEETNLVSDEIVSDTSNEESTIENLDDSIDTSSTTPTEVVDEGNQDGDEDISSDVSSSTDVTTDDDTGNASSTDVTDEDSGDTSESLATTTVEGPATETPVNVNFSDSGFTFSKNECTELASGSFYCLEPQVNTLDDALFSASDSDGDLEIFLIRNGVQTQITHNLVDDAAPFFDQNSETIVWHRLLDDRYQIVSYDINSGIEEQLTNNSTNDMEPMRQGKYTVWQRWTNNNWDIMLFDGNKEIQITHSSAHDIAPYIHGSLIVWNRYTATGDKTIEMYDISSETYVTVDDPTGLSVSNPRMVLVYDQMHPNGDVVTKGYDLIAKRFIQLDTLPRQIPVDIPKSEPTHETRALIQSKPSIKGDEIKTSGPSIDDNPIITPPDSNRATSTEDLVLDMTSPDEPTASSSRASIDEFDLIIETTSSSTNSQ